MSNFKVGDRVKVTETCERKYLHGKTGVVEYVDKDDPECTYGVLVDGVAMWFCELDLQPNITPAVITVYAVCDENGKNPSKVFMFEENALNYGRLNLTNYSIRPYALTPINE